MTDRTEGPITALLSAHRNGDADALVELFETVCPELRRIAGRLMRNERQGHLLQPTGLVNEAFLRLLNGTPVAYADSATFFAAAVRNMRRVLTDYARCRLAQKRQCPDGPYPLGAGVDFEQLIDLNLVLDDLERHMPLAAEVIGLKFYAGFSIKEIAASLNMSPRSVDRTWEWARAWLSRKLGGADRRDFAPSKQ